MPSSQSSLIDIVQDRAREQADRLAYRFLVSGDISGPQLAWTYGDLERRARTVAAMLQDAGAAGERVLLLYPPDLEFVAGFLGCVFAGAIAVPTYPPDPTRLDRTLPRLRAIASDCQAGFVLTSTAVLTMAQVILPQAPELSRLRWIASDQPTGGAGPAWLRPAIRGDSPAFLQYTSGSTGTPKGVIVSHANVHHNERIITLGFDQDASSSGVGWLPLFHDMGLLGNVLQPLYVGFPCTLMSPLAFLSRPLRWLEAISHFRATTSGGPNFAYELCARKVTEQDRERLDLRSWTLAFNGAEPIRPETLDRFADAFAPCGFRRQAFYPCYGLAEATLFVTGGERSQPPIVAAFDAEELARNRVVPGRAEATTVRLVSSGHALLDQHVAIVDPETGTRCAPDRVGEIWTAGPSVARGYWGLPDESTRTFAAFIAATGEGPYLRTGDLGFVHHGELFVTGRLKDVIIIRGRNHYPQDIEQTVMQAHPSIRTGGCACFAIDHAGEERLGVVAETQLDGGAADDRATDEIIAALRRAIIEGHDVSPHAIVLIRPRTLPKTSSGKIQRRACRDDYLAGRLAVLGAWVSRATAVDPPGGPGVAMISREQAEALRADGRSAELRAAIERAVGQLVAETVGVDPAAIDRTASIAGHGVDSLRAMQLVNQIRSQFALEIPLRELFEAPTVARLAAWVDTALREPAPGSVPALVRTPGPGPHPASFPQERLWFLERASPRPALYNISMSVRLRGPLDHALLTRSMREIVRRHEVLRAWFEERDGRIWQRIADDPELEIARVDLAALAPAARDAELLRHQDQVARSPFALGTPLLLRAVLYRLSDTEHAFLLTMHHIVSDGWSMAVVLRELSTLYGAYARDLPSPLAPLAFQYSDFSAWQIGWLGDDVLAPHLAYWRARLVDAPAPLQIPHDWPRSADRTPQGRRLGARLPVELGGALARLSQCEGATLFMTMFAAFAALLHRLTGAHDIVVGIPVSNRPRAELEPMIGLFLNNLALRVEVSGDGTFQDLLRHVRSVTLDAYEHRNLPFDTLLNELRRIRPGHQMPLYRLFFNMIDFPDGQLALPGLTVDSITSPDVASKMDVSFYVMDTPDGIVLEMVYDAAILAASRVEDMLQQYGSLLAQIVAQPAAKLTEYTL